MRKYLTILFLLPLILFAQYPVTDKDIIFQEQFTSEYDVLKNSGAVSDVNFAYGIAYFNQLSDAYVSYSRINIGTQWTLHTKLKGVWADGILIGYSNTSVAGTDRRYLFQIDNTVWYCNDYSGDYRQHGQTLTNNIFYDFIVVRNGAVVILYINGVKVTNEITLSSPLNSHFFGTFGNNPSYIWAGSSDFYIDYAVIYNRSFSESEVENLYNKRTLIPFPQQVNEQSLQLLSKIESSQGVIYDVMGNTIVNTNVETIDIGQTEVQNYSGNGHLVLGNIGTVNTLNFILYYDGTDQSGIIDLDGGTNTVEHSGGTLTYWGDDAYINGVNTNTLTYGWNYITIIDNTGQAASAYRIGYDGSDYFTGYLGVVESYSGVFTLTQHTQFWTYNKQYLK